MDILNISILLPLIALQDHHRSFPYFRSIWKMIKEYTKTCRAYHCFISWPNAKHESILYIYIYNRLLVMMVVQCPNLPAISLLINSLFKLTTTKTPNFGTTGSFMWWESTSELSITPQTYQNCGKRFYILSILYAIILHISFIITGPMW